LGDQGIVGLVYREGGAVRKVFNHRVHREHGGFRLLC
jgi:hypothetical protein